jgi:hypothetical protein
MSKSRAGRSETAVAFQPPHWRFTTDQFQRMGEAGIFRKEDRVELLDGEMYDRGRSAWFTPLQWIDQGLKSGASSRQGRASAASAQVGAAHRIEPVNWRVAGAPRRCPAKTEHGGHAIP